MSEEQQRKFALAVTMEQPMIPAPMTPRVLRINLPRERVPALLADIDAWRAQTGQSLRFSGVLCGPYARLYLQPIAQPVPESLIAILLPSIRERSGSIAPVGAWIIQLEVAPVLDEAALWQAVEVA